MLLRVRPGTVVNSCCLVLLLGRSVCLYVLHGTVRQGRWAGSCAPEDSAEHRDASYVSLPPSHPLPRSVDLCLLALKETRFSHIKKHLLLLTSTYWDGISIYLFNLVLKSKLQLSGVLFQRGGHREEPWSGSHCPFLTPSSTGTNE